MSDGSGVRIALEVAQEQYAWMRKHDVNMPDVLDAMGKRHRPRPIDRAVALSVLAAEWLKLRKR